MIAVLDTNVLVSALLSPFGNPARVLDLVLDGEVQLAYDDRLLAEYRQVLARPRFGFEQQAVADLLEYLTSVGYPMSASLLDGSLPDPDDQAFLEVAAASGAVLVTGNLRHFPVAQRGDVQVQSPADFVKSWHPANSEG